MQPIVGQLFAWYTDNKRDLPWRNSRDPYAIWVSEVMLQQTRVETVIPYYQKWMDRFPTIEALATAELEQVLILWEGLGYYRRARYLHQAAQELLAKSAGQLPKSPRSLRELPGIGEYTAAAISAIAFDQDAVALDGNLKRVLARLFDVRKEIESAEAKHRLRQIGHDLLPPGRASEFNQALMDLGATVCTPQNPKCSDCPLRKHCLAYASDSQHELPVRRSRVKVPHLERSVAVVKKKNRVLLGRRPAGGLLADLWEFPGLAQQEVNPPQSQLANWLEGKLGIRVNRWESANSYQHAYSHFKVTVYAYPAQWIAGEPKSDIHTEYCWVPFGELDQYPMGKVDRMIAGSLVD